MEDHERQLVVDRLTAGCERLLNLVHGLTEEQWRFRPVEGRWSIGECLEHVTRVENRILSMIGKKLSESAPQPEARTIAERNEKDALIGKIMPDRTIRREAPEAVRPGGQWTDSNELAGEFRKARQRTREFVAGTQGDLRGYFAPHPALGELDCYQWLLLAGLHGDRHAQQMEEIKAAPGFPAATASPASS